MKQNRHFGSMLLAFGLLYAPMHIMAQESTGQKSAEGASLAPATNSPAGDQHHTGDRAAEAGSAYGHTRNNPADCSFIADDTYAVTDAICH